VFINLITGLLHFALCHFSTADELICILLRGCFAFADSFVHFRLGETWLVDFVVTIKTITNHINETIFSVFLPISYHKTTSSDNRFRFTGIHSKNRNSKRLNNIRRAFETSIINRICGETKLIISDNVHGATTLEFRKSAHVQSFVCCSLTWEGCITMTLDIHDLHVSFFGLNIKIILFSTCFTHRDCIL
jgi:hypothetical protein